MSTDSNLASPVLRTMPLGSQWQTLDPFLFCAHHQDLYPSGNAQLGPAATLAGRSLGQDFDGIDGWNMYHGQTVPGFPAHPHRGFETITYVRRGLCDHADSLGATARFGRGDVQWMTAGSGIVHSEMFPLVDRDEPNPLHLFQIWLNLPAADKLVDPYFTMLWADDIPRVTHTDAAGHRSEVTVLAGRFAPPDGEDVAEPLAPPPNSWAAKPEADVAVWHLALSADAQLDLPAAASGSTRALYLFDGDGLAVEGHEISADTGAVLAADRVVTLTASRGPVDAMVLQGRPLDEPVAQYGPFVMNTHDEIQQAMVDYRQTGFGGWPWDSDEPNHGPSKGRFAIHADGRTEQKS